MSWIWLADGSVADADRNPAMNEALRIEWAKTRALGLRNTEEWESKKVHGAETRADLLNDARQCEGHDAYATRQARILRSLALDFELKWVGMAALIAAGRAEVAAVEAEAVAEAAAEAADKGDEDGEEGDGADEGDGEGKDSEEGDGADEGDDKDEGSEEGQPTESSLVVVGHDEQQQLAAT
ncbi:hypothetical protein C8F04DRAFT_1279600 [Mycena alexandri]|uniref:Uncharacterized protein n=1 Tax=Mycena alexandri TaxID=1745969 RepID=A0AAD6WKP0_9AGAR|nr:hypothetical protein C8F04DRAFT_1279600 [Mycena alexandri]